MTTNIITTKRLLLRAWRDEDLPAFADLNSDPKVMKHFPSQLSRAESDDLAGRIRALLEKDEFGLWAVEVAGRADFIGFIGLHRPHFDAHFTPCVEIGWRLAAEHWGQGLATEGALAVLNYGFNELELGEIVSMTSTGNLASRRVMEKLGMKRHEDDDFDHPSVPLGHHLRRHVLYRLSRSR